MFDAYVRLRLGDLHAIRPRHLQSGADDPVVDAARHGETLTGYTEWVAEASRKLSMGWDWSLEPASTAPVAHWETLRTNLMLTNEHGEDLGAEFTQRGVAELMARSNWAATVFASIEFP